MVQTEFQLHAGSQSYAIADTPVRKSADRLGQLLLDAELISQTDLRQALAQKHKSGAPLGEVLLENQKISEESLARALAHQWSLPVVNLDIRGPEVERLVRADPKACIRTVSVPWRLKNGIPVIAVADPARIEDATIACGYAGQQVNYVISTRSQILRSLERFFSQELEQDARHSCPPAMSARNRNARRTILAASLVILAICSLAVWSPVALFWTVFAAILLVNGSTAVFRLSLLAARLWPERQKYTKDQSVASLSEHRKLPRVSLMIGLLHEDLVVPNLLKHLANLDYPKELLDILLLLEEGDEVTKKHLASVNPPPRDFDVIEVPKGVLRTKPRALNYGLSFARGEIIGILDAEDRPDPDQIREVVRTLGNAPPEVACVQGVLDFYNDRRNWLSRCFAIEYAIWFRVLLKGMQRLRLPIPLGGTTVYFRRRALEQVGGWDAYNVTEDADLGMRLARFGYRTEVMSSVTLEEANAAALPWVRQRSRWIKGYLVTWMTHMRQPLSLLRDLGLGGFLAFHVLFLGGVTAYLSIPILWALWIGVLGFDLKAHLGGLPEIWELAFWSMIFGQLVMLLVAATALLKKDKRRLIPWIATLPIYWPLGALAGLKAVYELVLAPYYWDKTKHGRQSDQTTVKDTSPKLLMETDNSQGSLTG